MIVIDGNKRYTVHIYDVKMYTGNNPFKYAFWRLYGRWVGNYRVRIYKNTWRKR